MRIISAFCIAVFILTSCGGKYSIQKRRYSKGYYIAHSGQQKTTQERTAQTGKALAVSKKEAGKTKDVTDQGDVLVIHQIASPKKHEQKLVERKEEVYVSAQKKSNKTAEEYKPVHSEKFNSLFVEKKSKLHPPYQYGYNSGGGMGAWGIIGAISSLISLIVVLIYLALWIDAITAGAYTPALIGGIVLIAIVFIVAAIFVAATGMGS